MAFREEKKEYDRQCKLCKPPKKGAPYTDDEIRLILRSPATFETILRLAKGLGRGYGGVEQVYRWASRPKILIRGRRSTDKFVCQVKRVAKEVGFRV